MTTFIIVLIGVYLIFVLSSYWIRFVNWLMNPMIKRAEEREKEWQEKNKT